MWSLVSWQLLSYHWCVYEHEEQWCISSINIAPINWWLVHSQVSCAPSDVHNSEGAQTFSHLAFTCLSSQCSNSLSDRNLCLTSPIWTQCFCAVFHPSLLRELGSKFRVKSAAFCFKAPSESSSSSSSSILQKVWAIRYLFSCPQRFEAWLNKEAIHALVDLLCSLIHSLRWTLLFAGTTNVLVEHSGRESSLSMLDWYGWKIASCWWRIICECTHAHTLST